MQAQEKKTRILFILDASSSMTYTWNDDYNRFAIARNILLQIVDSIYDVNNEVEFAVRLYGSDYPSQQKNCTDSRLLVPFNLQNVNQIKQSLRYTEPIGWSPIAYSLKQAAFGEISNANIYDYSIIFITDGGESCGGDICKTFLELLEKKVSVKPYIIGLDNNENLKAYYDCLGKFVPVLNVGDIPKAVKLIVDENRPILNKEKQLNLKTIYSNSPIKESKEVITKKIIEKPEPKTILNPKKEEVVKEEPKKEIFVFKGLGPNGHKILPQSNDKIAPPNFILFTKQIAYNLSYEEIPVVRPAPIVIRALEPNNYIKLPQPNEKVSPPNFVFFTKQIAYNLSYEEIPVVRPQPIVIKPMQGFAARHRFAYAMRIPPMTPGMFMYDKVQYNFEFMPIKRDTVKVVQSDTKKVKPIGTDGLDNEINTGVSREVVPYEETMVQVYFVNKFQKKRMYKDASPTVILQDGDSKREVSRFIRSTSNGVPDMKPIQPGTYNFVIQGDNRIMTPKVRIDQNKINKVFIEVTDGTIEFAYVGNLKRPMTEFQATIKPRFISGAKIVIQECKDKLYYPPGTYYIEINTLPPSKFAMVEMDFGEIRSMQIPEPGFLQINNTNRLGKVDFYHVLNDSYVRFFDLTVNGNVIDQKIRLQPSGSYKAVFSKNPNVPELGSKEINFTIQSNKTTQLMLE